MTKYRKKPVVIDAWKLNQSNHAALAVQIAEAGYNVTHSTTPPFRAVTGLNIHTLDGVMTANYGDWIIKGVNGEYYPCKDDIFQKTYEAA